LRNWSCPVLLAHSLLPNPTQSTHSSILSTNTACPHSASTAQHCLPTGGAQSLPSTACPQASTAYRWRPAQQCPQPTAQHYYSTVCPQVPAQHSLQPTPSTTACKHLPTGDYQPTAVLHCLAVLPAQNHVAQYCLPTAQH
jgi:hypothetical protein